MLVTSTSSSSWPDPSPLAAPSSAWDEEISVGLQEEELQMLSTRDFEKGPLAPIPEDVPPPFGLHALSAGSSESSALAAPSCTPAQEVMDVVQERESMDAGVDLLARLSDGRSLRGKPPNAPSNYPRHPHGRDPGSLATPKSSCTRRGGLD